jgi:hypothetical protein
MEVMVGGISRFSRSGNAMEGFLGARGGKWRGRCTWGGRVLENSL